MAKKSNKAKDDKPELIRVMLRQERAAQRGWESESAFLADELARLGKDPRQVFLAHKWLIDITRAAEVGQIRWRLRDEGIWAALRRSDLTVKEGLQVIQALAEAEADCEAEALAQLARKRLAESHR